MAADPCASPVAKRRKLQHHRAIPDIVKTSTKCSFTGDTMKAIEDKELWLIAVPMQFKVEDLNGMMVDLESSKDFEVQTGSDDKVATAQYTSVPRSCKMKACFPFVPVGEKPGRLSIGHSFCGELSIQKCLSVPEIQLSPRPKKSVQFPTDLKQRWKPFGLYRKQASQDTALDDTVSSPVKELDISPRKSKKKSKSKRA